MDWTIWLIVAIFLTIAGWLWSGWHKLSIGWRGAILFFGHRTGGEVGEGWRCKPWPWAIQGVDCHQKTISLDTLENVVTKDNVEVDISGSIIRDISDVNIFLGVDEATIKDGLDDIWDERIRALVGQMDLSDVLRMKDVLARTAREGMDLHTSVSWGVSIIKVNISEVKTDEGVREDLERQEREELQRKGQRVQAEWTGQLENYFMGIEPLTQGGTLGPKLSPEAAHELTLYTLELAEKKKVGSQTFGLDPTTATAITAALAAIMGGRHE